MKVLHIVGDSKYGGGSIIILELARMTIRDGWEVDVLTTDPTFQQILQEAGIGVVDLDVIWRDIRPLRDLLGLYRLYRFLRKSGYMLVHTHTSKAGWVGRLAARLAGTPAIVHTAHGFAFHEQSPRWVVTFYSWMERMAAHWCHRIVTVSEFHRNWALQLGIGDEQKIVAIPNGISEARVAPCVGRDHLRASLGVSPDDFVILSTGRLAPQKGLELLLEATSTLRQHLQRPFKVWLAGDGPLRRELENLATNFGITDTVRFLGFRSDLGDLLAASDLVVLPSLREGLSIALLEAMAAAKPVVATTIGSNREVARNGEGALLVPPGGSQQLVEAVRRLAADPQLARSLGQRAREIFLATYTDQRMLSSYRAQYLRLAKRSSRQPLLKRALDVLVSASCLLLLGPLMLILAAAVRLTSSGPALFRQRRLGRNGKPFTIYKYRTMFVGVPDWRNPDGSTFNATHDPRVTPLGRLLRKTSLDEVPQLINVLKGDMSLVGPRPDLLDQLRYYTEEDLRKLDVKPGITGLAQLSGRNSIPWEKRKQLDITYACKQSLLLDIRILLKTVPYVLKRKGVYCAEPEAESRLPVSVK